MPPMKARKTQPVTSDMPKWLQESTTLNIDSQMKIDNTDRIDQYMAIKQNKTKFNDFLKQERDKRIKEEKVR